MVLFEKESLSQYFTFRFFMPDIPVRKFKPKKGDIKSLVKKATPSCHSVLLSGGVDSSIVASIGDCQIAYCVGFDHDNEFSSAAERAGELGLDFLRLLLNLWFGFQLGFRAIAQRQL